MSSLTSLLRLFSQPKRLKSLLSFGEKGYLAQIGWFKSFDSHTPVDNQGKPIPWVTYSFIDFITGRLQPTHRVFEFGSGNSTFFYADHVEKVVSVEHDKAWFEKVQQNRPANAEIIFSELATDAAYCRTPLKLNQEFDIIIVDGRDRVNCCKQCLPALSLNGVVVLDDSEREHYREAIDFLQDKGFKQLSFSGISPGLFYLKSTSVFYRENNCLGI